MLQTMPPIVVEVVKQPPITREISMGDVVLSAVGLTGVIMIGAVVAGLLIGCLLVWFKNSRERSAPPTDPGHARLRT